MHDTYLLRVTYLSDSEGLDLLVCFAVRSPTPNGINQTNDVHSNQRNGDQSYLYSEKGYFVIKGG